VSFRVLIVLLGAGVIGVTLLVFSALLYALASSGAVSNQDRDLVQRSARVEAFLRQAPPKAFQAQLTVAPIDLAESNDVFVEVLDSGGAPLSITGILNGMPPLVPTEILSSADSQGSVLTTLSLEPAIRVDIRPWRRADLGMRGYVVVGQATRAPQAAQAGARGFLWLSGVVTFIAAMIGVWLVAGRALRPLHQVANTAEDIRITGDLRRRLPESRGWVELNRLAGAFNGMLERLAAAQMSLGTALDAQRRFVADASHELRTPLTSIRSNADLLLGRTDLQPLDRDAALRDIHSESERMGRLVNDLLTLARADAGYTLEKRSLQLGPLVSEVGRQAQQLYPGCRFVVDECAVTVVGNADALTQLVWILLDNAVRFSPPGGCIGVSLSVSPDRVELRVADSGPGIGPDAIDHVFERFYQADRSRANGGAGLGLSIAHWIVGEHGGTISARNAESSSGGVFIVVLPAAPAPGAPLAASLGTGPAPR
jgi:two-component system OmpR family sensor kinase